MSGWRKIVVDKIEYRWKFGDVVLVRLDNKAFAKYDAAQLLGMNNSDYERACWKRYASVTPGIIADAIRTTKNGLTPALPKETRKLLSEINWQNVLRST